MKNPREFNSCVASRMHLLRSIASLSTAEAASLGTSATFHRAATSTAASLFNTPAACAAAPYATSSSDFGITSSRPERREIVCCHIFPLAPPPTRMSGASESMPEE